MKDYYLFIVSSLNHPIYRKVQKERTKILTKYKIPYSVLINEQESDINDKSVSTLLPLEKDEILYPQSGYNPSMAQKFLNAVKLYFRSFPDYESIPNYIVRINATVYIYFPALEQILENLPKEKVLAGPCWDSPKCETFMVGMLMIFSKDVLWNMIHSPKQYEKEIMKHADDVSLTILADPYCKRYNLMDHFVYPNDGDTLYEIETIQPFKNKKWFYRIRSLSPNRESDVHNFRRLCQFFDLNTSYQLQTSKNYWFYWILGICLTFLGATLFLFKRTK